MPAYILAGGESRRFGRDKTLLFWDGQPLVLRTVETVQQVAWPVKIVARERDKFSMANVPVLLDVVSGVGPLAGLVTALEDCPASRCFVLAADMPYLTPDWLRLLEQAPAAPVVYSSSPRGVEPLCAIYAKLMLPFWWERYRTGRHSLWDALQELGGMAVECPPERDPPPFFNLNTPVSLPSARRPRS